MQVAFVSWTGCSEQYFDSEVPFASVTRAGIAMQL